MAIGDRVVMVAQVETNKFGMQLAQPLIGTLMDAADPALVMWENGKTSTLELALLYKVLDAQEGAGELIAKWLQLRVFPSTAPGFGGGTPKSPAASGLGVYAFAYGAIGDEDPAGSVVVMTVQDSPRRIAVPWLPIPPSVGVIGPQSRDGRRNV